MRRAVFLILEENKVAALRQQPTFMMTGEDAVLHYETQPPREFFELNGKIWMALHRERPPASVAAEEAPPKEPAPPAPSLRGAQVFISCADTDLAVARNLYRDLRRRGHDPWLPKDSLVAGQDTRRAISHAIRSSKLFVALSSRRSLRERGYFRKELQQAVDILEEMPRDSVFIVPARVDECELDNEVLRQLFPVDLFPEYFDGVAKILKAVDLALTATDE